MSLLKLGWFFFLWLVDQQPNLLQVFKDFSISHIMCFAFCTFTCWFHSREWSPLSTTSGHAHPIYHTNCTYRQDPNPCSSPVPTAARREHVRRRLTDMKNKLLSLPVFPIQNSGVKVRKKDKIFWIWYQLWFKVLSECATKSKSGLQPPSPRPLHACLVKQPKSSAKTVIIKLDKWRSGAS